MKQKIFLVGLMGAGKSTVGRQLARRLRVDFYDSDRLIVERTGVPIATIFDIEGEDGFRERETQVLQELSTYQGCVIATGGGSLIRPENREIIKNSGCVVYLRASAEKLYSRIKHDKARPLMQTENPLQTLRDLLAVREPAYLDTADIVIRTGHEKVSVVMHRIEKALRRERRNANINR
ncbi:shikimate kinase [Leucothrix mucor]|uniref:shikimate kinase n=1 Tax=Leucothrix mucor TaxID=45248 RepID=UPI0003B496DA|nr:shikimate kinase [Leucothrix mucor]